MYCANVSQKARAHPKVAAAPRANRAHELVPGRVAEAVSMPTVRLQRPYRHELAAAFYAEALFVHSVRRILCYFEPGCPQGAGRWQRILGGDRLDLS